MQNVCQSIFLLEKKRSSVTEETNKTEKYKVNQIQKEKIRGIDTLASIVPGKVYETITQHCLKQASHHLLQRWYAQCS